MGTKAERATISPECISSETLTRCLLQTPSITEEQDRQCWQEFDDIMANCARCVEPAPDSDSSPLGAGAEGAGTQTCSQAQRRARARSRFVAALAEWVNMHDYHEPFANGPPAAHQSCAAEDKGRLHGNKLFSRKLVHPGKTEISEDPRRRDLFRSWLGRNCHFMNNFVPIIMLAMLSNCDFQATLTKDAVVEYMTKYMTKSGQGSLVKVMEQSFSLCVEKARDKNQGSGSAMLRWFNVQSITEVKSQLETMHLIFGAPRFLCSRDFSDMWLRSEIRKIRSPQDIAQASSSTEKLTSDTDLEKYRNRLSWTMPCDQDLVQGHPLTGVPFWCSILTTLHEKVLPWEIMSDRYTDVQRAWPQFLELLSWWKIKRYFQRKGSSLKYKSKANVVVVHPEPRFTTAMTSEQWREACILALMAFCNHGSCCASTTFRDVNELEEMDSDKLEMLMHDFVHLDGEQRLVRMMTSCPPHVSRACTLGHARRKRMEERKAGRARVSAVLPNVKYIFAEENHGWQGKTTANMSADEASASQTAWTIAEAEDIEEAKSRDVDRSPDGADESAIHERMKTYVRQWQVTVRELHNATLAAGLQVPGRPSWLNSLLMQFLIDPMFRAPLKVRA